MQRGESSAERTCLSSALWCKKLPLRSMHDQSDTHAALPLLAPAVVDFAQLVEADKVVAALL